MNQYNSIDPYGTYDVKGLSPYEMAMKMASWNQALRSTLNKTNEDLSNVESVIVQHADAIGLRVMKEDYTGEIVASMIALDPYSVTIIANSLNLSGYVTFSSLTQAGSTVINGANITTGSILANRLAVGELSAISSKLGYVDAGYIYGVTIEGGTISGAILNGGQLNAVNINTSNNITVGNTLNIGNSYTGSFAIRFGGSLGGGSINYSFDDLYLTAINAITLTAHTAVRFQTPEIDFRSISSLLGVARSTTTGLELGYASGTNELVVRISGSERGRVKLT